MIVGGTVHPVSGPVIKNGIVVISNGMVTSVGTQIMMPRGALTTMLAVWAFIPA